MAMRMRSDPYRDPSLIGCFQSCSKGPFFSSLSRKNDREPRNEVGLLLGFQFGIPAQFFNSFLFLIFQLKENWRRRCSLSLARQEEKRKQDEEERYEHERNVARRTSTVEQQRRKSRGIKYTGLISSDVK